MLPIASLSVPITAAGSATPLPAILPEGAGMPESVAPQAPFADLITEAVGQVQGLEQQAKSSIEGLIAGRGVDIHEAMIAVQKAGMGFELALSVRNKALAAYQQVMGMQF
jgi:flagellar hook-basal body complex protein FliE